MDAHLHSAGVAIADLDMAVDDHRFADEAHCPHADAVAEFLELEFQLGDFRIRVAITDGSETGGSLAENHASVFRTSQNPKTPKPQNPKTPFNDANIE